MDGDTESAENGSDAGRVNGRGEKSPEGGSSDEDSDDGEINVE